MNKFGKYLMIFSIVLLSSLLVWFAYLKFSQPKQMENQENSQKVEQKVYDSNSVNNNSNATENLDNFENLANENSDFNNETNNTQTEVNNISLDEEDLDKIELENKAKSFIEVYGTYSTDNAYKNLLEVKNLVTREYWNKLESYIDTEKLNDNVYSIVTEAYSSEVKDYLLEEKAVVKVKVKRKERESVGAKVKEYRDTAIITYVFENGEWLVNNVDWQNK